MDSGGTPPLPTRQASAVAIGTSTAPRAWKILFANGQRRLHVYSTERRLRRRPAPRSDLATPARRCRQSNGDGAPDIFYRPSTAGNRLARSYLYFNDGKAPSSGPAGVRDHRRLGRSIGDLNAAAAAFYRGPSSRAESFEVASYISELPGASTRHADLALCAGPWATPIADFNGDGHLDVCQQHVQPVARRWAPAFVFGAAPTKPPRPHAPAPPSSPTTGRRRPNEDGWPDLVSPTW
jgi:hypothetical protein